MGSVIVSAIHLSLNLYIADTASFFKGGFSARAENWGWSIYELIWISGFALLFLAFLLPETYEANILLKRARHLRKFTGNPNLRSQSEIDEARMNHREFIYESLVRPFLLAAKPAVLFLNLYLGLVSECRPVFFLLSLTKLVLFSNFIYGLKHPFRLQ